LDKQSLELTSLKETLDRLEAQHRELSAHVLHVETMCADMLTAAQGLVDLLLDDLYRKSRAGDVWCTLRVSDAHTGYFSEVLGVFSTEDGAVAACSQPYDLVGRVALDTDYGDTKQVWPGAYYPLAAAEQ
jgi:hypothetical protein